ncbi:DUF2798 domain-containing protein [Neobacillus drentensis]|uniref:DUF2798 domain-containing protein n=1 Tax=Neobacillus drentensis TaxID=220684 RepID=UPI002FFE4D59
MGNNLKERLVFTTLMCALMVFGMSLYNLVLLDGFSPDLVIDLLRGYLPGFAVALILDIFVVGRFAKGLLLKFTSERDHTAKKVLLMSLFMVTGMVLFMSLYGALVNGGLSAELPHKYLTGIIQNFIFALPLQLLIIGPIVRVVFNRIYSKADMLPSN